MRNAPAIAIAMLTLVGCRSATVLDRDLPALTGKDVHLIADRLGYPDQVDVMMGEKVYRWHMNNCTLHVAVDATEHVVRSDYNGGRDECAFMANRLNYNDTEYRAQRSKTSHPVATVDESRGAANSTKGAPKDSAAKAAPQAAPTTQTPHVRLGVHCMQITPALAQTYHLPVETGLRVVTLESGSVAEASGIKVGDVLLKYGDRSLNEIGDLVAAIAATPPGAQVSITIWRQSGQSVADVQF
jgi:PDZ domain